MPSWLNPIKYLDSFVITSRIEGGPVPLLEAMATGLPVVTTRVGVALEIIEDGVNGYLVDFNSPEQMRARLEALKEQPDVASSIGQLARQIIVERCQWKHTTRNILGLYAVAEKNFLERSDQYAINRRPWTQNDPGIRAMKRWVSARECLHFAKFLKQSGARSASIRLLTKAVSIAPFDLNVIKRAASLLVTE